MSTTERKREKRRAGRAPQVVVNDTVWTLVVGSSALEPVVIAGREARRVVDTQIYCYRMACRCGRVRYAKANNLHEISSCRVCHRKIHLAKRRSKEIEQT